MFAYIHFPKAAGSTIATILRQSFLSRHCDVRVGNAFRAQPQLTSQTLKRIRWFYPRLESIQGHGVVPCSDLYRDKTNWRFYALFRDPMERCASEYQYRVIRGGLELPFEAWIKQPIARNRMTKMLCGREDSRAALRTLDQRVECVGLMNRFDEFLVLLRHWMSTPRLDIRYRKKNVISSNHIKRRLLQGTATRRLLYEANRHDAELFQYVQETVYPRQKQLYGNTLAADVQQFRAANRRPLPYPRQLPSMLKREFLYKPMALRMAAA